MLRTSKFLILFLLLAVLQNTFSQNLKKSFYKTSLRNQIYELQSDRIRLFVEENSGKFYIKTTGNKNIIYYDSTRPDFFTSHFNIKIDDSVFSNDAKMAQKTLTNQLTGLAKIDTNYISTEFSAKNGKINITQKLTPVNYYGMGAMIIEVTIKNNDNTAHNIGALMEFDLQVNENDGANFKTNLGTIYKDTTFSGSDVPFFWRAYEMQESDSNFIIQGNLKGELIYNNISNKSGICFPSVPDLLIFDEWEKLYNVVWDYSNSVLMPFSDGAAILRWNEKTIQPDSSITFTVFLGESRGSFSNGKLIINSFTLKELVYNGNRYTPDPLEFFSLIYNNSEETVNNISSSIELPYGLFTDTIIQKSTPDLLTPYNVGIIKYFLHPKMSAESKTPIVKLNLNSTAGQNSCNSIIRIPAAPNADTLDPHVMITGINCGFSMKVVDNRTNDKGIDSILVLSSENMLYSYDKFSKGDTAINISGSLKIPGKPGSVNFRIYDLAGNYTEQLIKSNPDIIGFDNEQVGSGNLIFIPFKIKSKDEQRTDTVLTCKLKFDPNYLKPESIPIEIQRDKVDDIILSDVVTGKNEISFKLTNKNGFRLGTLALLQFVVLSNVKDSTKLTIEELILNHNPNYCVYTTNADILFNTPDQSPPKISLKQFNCRFIGAVTDNREIDKGIYNIFLSNSFNAAIITNESEPGKKELNISITPIDSSLIMNGSLVAVDGSGNYSSFFFQLDPVLIKIDTVIASSKEKITASLFIYGELPDMTLRDYSFRITYDTSILKSIPPFFNKSACTGSDFNVFCDTSTAGKLMISASGATSLSLGRLLNLLFEVKPGNDTTTVIRFDYFYMKNGLKGVHTKDGIIIRKNTDSISPEINYTQKRNNITVIITEEKHLDLGIDSVAFYKVNNFTMRTGLISDTKRIYYLAAIDSTKISSCVVSTYDILGNNSKTDIYINPIKLILPDSIKIDNDSASIPLFIKASKNVILNSLSFKLAINPNFFVIPDTVKIFSTSLFNINAKYNESTSLLSISAEGNINLDTLLQQLMTINLKTNLNNKTTSEIHFSDIVINHDSLFAYGNRAYTNKTVSDTTGPNINIIKFNCGYYIQITDVKGIAKIKIDSLRNIKDTVIFLSPFKTFDTSASIKIYPIDYTKESGLIITAIDSMGNISQKGSSSLPVCVSLPQKTQINGGKKSNIPVNITWSSKDKINNLSIKIKFDENIVAPDTNYISFAGSLLENAVTSISLLPPNFIQVTANNILSLNSNRLFNLYFTGEKGDSLISSLSIESLSINSDSICSYHTDGIVYRSKTNNITVSVEPITKGQIGKEVVIPINISGDYTNYIFSNIKIQLSFNPSLLKPTEISSSGMGLKNFTGSLYYDNNGKLTLNYSGNSAIVQNMPLSAFVSKVLLGDEDSTVIKIDSFIYSYSNSIAAPQVTSENGIFVISGRLEWQEGLKLKKDYLYQNHPNPYNSSTVIRFTIKTNCQVNLTIYDVLGREILKPVNEYLESGEHHVTIKSNNLPSGVYYYHLKTDSYSQIKKMVLLK